MRTYYDDTVATRITETAGTTHIVHNCADVAGTVPILATIPIEPGGIQHSGTEQTCARALPWTGLSKAHQRIFAGTEEHPD
ncbi:MAG: hypothetical protein GDA36_04325 [Rhodobacteraceae bacterium]|nr:hypothetical protein [Paracoccaceae bacterium]